MARLWIILAGVCILAAAVFLWRGNFDAAFVAAVIGVVSWFLNYRTQVSQSLAAEDLQDSDDREGGDNSNED